MRYSIFRPNEEPARTLHDAFQIEAGKRFGRSVGEWQAAERRAVWSAARDYAQQHGLQVLTLAEIQQAESLAYGYIDYGAKWACGIAEKMRAVDQESKQRKE